MGNWIVVSYTLLNNKMFIDCGKIIHGKKRTVQNLKRLKGKESKELTPWIRETVSGLFSKHSKQNPVEILLFVILYHWSIS